MPSTTCTPLPTQQPQITMDGLDSFMTDGAAAQDPKKRKGPAGSSAAGGAGGSGPDFRKPVSLVEAHDKQIRVLDAAATFTWKIPVDHALAEHLLKAMEAWKVLTPKGLPHPLGPPRAAVLGSLLGWLARSAPAADSPALQFHQEVSVLLDGSQKEDLGNLPSHGEARKTKAGGAVLLKYLPTPATPLAAAANPLAQLLRHHGAERLFGPAPAGPLLRAMAPPRPRA